MIKYNNNKTFPPTMFSGGDFNARTMTFVTYSVIIFSQGPHSDKKVVGR